MPIRNDEEFCEYFLGNTEEEAMENYHKFYSTIKYLSYNYAALGADYEDLFQEGLIGLARAVKTFNEERSSGDRAFKIFAIYHIKNAMREFAAKQSVALKTPQYLMDGVRLLITLKELLMQAGEPIEFLSATEIWDLAAKRNGKTKLDKDIKDVLNKLTSLADRSSSSINNLLRRIEPLPLQTSDIETNTHELTSYEDHIIDAIETNDMIRWLMDILTEEEFELLWQRYVNKIPLRILADKMNVSAVSVSNILQKLKQKINKQRKHEML